MKISILVPTRERMNNRLTLLFSILTTVSDINNINVYYGVDKDDPTLDTIKKVSQSLSKLKKDLSWQPKYTFETMLDEMIEYWVDYYEK
jgi:nucleoside-diphosphate-sugar epimerase